jgi:hypothetical protein
LKRGPFEDCFIAIKEELLQKEGAFLRPIRRRGIRRGIRRQQLKQKLKVILCGTFSVQIEVKGV